MDSLLTVAFEAHRAGLDHYRRSQVTLARELLDDWAASISYSRIGKGGRPFTTGYADA